MLKKRAVRQKLIPEDNYDPFQFSVNLPKLQQWSIRYQSLKNQCTFYFFDLPLAKGTLSRRARGSNFTISQNRTMYQENLHFGAVLLNAISR